MNLKDFLFIIEVLFFIKNSNENKKQLFFSELD